MNEFNGLKMKFNGFIMKFNGFIVKILTVFPLVKSKGKRFYKSINKSFVKPYLIRRIFTKPILLNYATLSLISIGLKARAFKHQNIEKDKK